MIKTKNVLLIDGDVFIYKVGLAAERSVDWGDDVWTLWADFAECKTTFDATIASLKEKLEAEDVIIALSCPTETGFRRELCPTYKSNRADKRKPIVYRPLREYVLTAYDTILRDRLEADDVLGILATKKTPGERRIIVSVDKDFQGVPCLLYRTCEENPEVREVTADQARRFHAIQTLMGDRVDGYAGIPGCGPKTAEKILAGVPTDNLWPAIVKAYDEAGLGEDLALTTARLARILHYSDYDTKTGKIKLWLPNLSSPAVKRPISQPRKVVRSPALSGGSKVAPATLQAALPTPEASALKTPVSVETSPPEPSVTAVSAKDVSTSSP